MLNGKYGINNLDLSVFNNKKILITGHTGFKGSWLTNWLIKNGAQVTGYALKPKTERDNYCLTGIPGKIKEYFADIRDKEKVLEVFKVEKPEIVFHLAAQPLVLSGYINPLYTIDTNVMGTANILEAFRVSDSASLAVIVSSDKVYDNIEQVKNYKEDDLLGGSDPYSASKTAAEIITGAFNKSYLEGNGKKVVTVRSGNVIGGGDWSDYRIVPDCIKAIEKNEDIVIRNPKATRPWQHVLEPLGGYLILADQILKGKNFVRMSWNFGPDNSYSVSVEDVVKKIVDYYGKGNYILNNKPNGFRESSNLSLDTSKAEKELKWKTCFTMDETIKLTTDWYKSYKTENMFSFGINQINEYEKKWNLKSLN